MDILLAATAFMLLSKHHPLLQATIVQQVFGRDMIINTFFIADWKYISRRKQELIYINNQN